MKDLLFNKYGSAFLFTYFTENMCTTYIPCDLTLLFFRCIDQTLLKRLLKIHTYFFIIPLSITKQFSLDSLMIC